MSATSPISPQCHICKSNMRIEGSYCQCEYCGHVYSTILGIIDMRQPELDRESALQDQMVAVLRPHFEGSSFSELVDLYLRTAQVPSDLRDYFKNYFLTQEGRGQRFTEMFLSHLETQFGPCQKSMALELGCGAGAGLIALAHKFEYVVGLDSFMPSLILARKVLDTHSIANVLLVCGHGQNIPFPENTFDYASAQNVLEHVFDAGHVISEVARSLKMQGGFVADSRNRFDLFFPEPHVKLRYVGYLPRRWAAPYVLARAGKPYYDVFLLSYGNLDRILQQSFANNHAVVFPDVVVYGIPAWVDSLLRRIEKFRLLATMLLWVFPSHLVVATKRPFS